MGSQTGTPETVAGTPGTQVLACPPTQTGSITQIRSTSITRDTVQTRTTTQSRTETYACPAPTGAYTTTYSAWSAPSAPYGAWSAPTPAGSWSAPGAPYGAWATTSNTCVTPPPPPPAVPNFDCLETPFPDTWAYLNPLGSGHAIRTHTYNAPKSIDRWNCNCANGTTLTQVGTQATDPFEQPYFSTYKLYKCSGTATAPAPPPATTIAPYTRSWTSSSSTCSATVPAGTSSEGDAIIFIDNTPPGIGVGRFQIYIPNNPATITTGPVYNYDLGPNELYFSWCVP
jgi:hypothetical protein